MKNLLIAFFVVISCHWSLQVRNLTCHTDASISIGDIEAQFAHVYAVNKDDVICDITAVVNNEAMISNCEADKYIIISYSSYNMSENNIRGGQQVEHDNITCVKIPETVLTVNNSYSTNLTIAVEKAIATTYTVSSALDVYAQVVGLPVVLTITYPPEYDLQVMNCTANPSNIYNESVAVTLVTDYCSLETELITDFTGSGGTVSATITAFQFYQDADVFIRCYLKICQASAGCTTNCTPSAGRRRREMDWEDGSETYESEIDQVLHVLQPGSSAIHTAASLMATILLVLVLLV